MMDGAAYDLWPRVILNTVLFALLAISFFRPSAKRTGGRWAHSTGVEQPTGPPTSVVCWAT
jgi:hypothetical protein